MPVNVQLHVRAESHGARRACRAILSVHAFSERRRRLRALPRHRGVELDPDNSETGSSLGWIETVTGLLDETAASMQGLVITATGKSSPTAWTPTTSPPATRSCRPTSTRCMPVRQAC